MARTAQTDNNNNNGAVRDDGSGELVDDAANKTATSNVLFAFKRLLDRSLILFMSSGDTPV